MQNFLYFYLYSVNFKKLKFICYKIIKIISMYFIYNIKGIFCKFFFFYFRSFAFFRIFGRGHFSLLKSPHVSKKAQAQFSRFYYKSILSFQISSFCNNFFLFYLFFNLNKVLQLKYSARYVFKYKKKFLLHLY